MTKRIGVVGGIASGKSTVVELLKSYGAVAIHADPIIHEILNSYEIQEQLRAYWRVGPDGVAMRYDLPPIKVFVDGKPYRPGIASLVFSKASEREFLEFITWEPFRDRVVHLTNAFQKACHPAIIYDIPLWFELEVRPLGLKLEQVCFVDCPLAERVKRYAARTGKDLKEAELDLMARECVQVPLQTKKLASAGFVVDNSQDENHLKTEVTHLWYKLGFDAWGKYRKEGTV